MATRTTKPAGDKGSGKLAGDKGSVKPAGDKGSVKPAGGKGSVSSSLKPGSTDGGPSWAKSLGQSVAGAVLNRVIAGPAMDWMASSFGLDFLAGGEDTTAKTLNEINDKLSTVISDLGEIKNQLTSIESGIRNLKATVEAGLESLHLSIKDVKYQQVQLRVVESANVIEGCFISFMSDIEKLANSKDQEKALKAFQTKLEKGVFIDEIITAMKNIHDFTVGNTGDSMVHYQQTLCDMALKENPNGVPLEVMRNLLKKVVIPQFKLVLTAQLKGLLYLMSVLDPDTKLLDAPIANLLDIMNGMKEWFAKLVETYGKDFNVSQTLFFYRLPTTTSELEALGDQAPGVKIQLRVFESPTFTPLLKPLEPYTDPRRFVGFLEDGKIGLFREPSAATKLWWYDVGDGKISITNQARTFYLHGQVESMANARADYYDPNRKITKAKADDAILPKNISDEISEMFKRDPLTAVKRLQEKYPEAYQEYLRRSESNRLEREKEFSQIRGEVIAGADKKPELTFLEYGMSMALKDKKGNVIIQDGQVLDLTRLSYFPGVTEPGLEKDAKRSGVLFQGAQIRLDTIKPTNFEQLMEGNLEGFRIFRVMNLAELKAGNWDAVFGGTGVGAFKATYKVSNFLRHIRYEVICGHDAAD
jgi:hypothetical protein